MRLKKAVEIAKQESPEAEAGEPKSDAISTLLNVEPAQDIDIDSLRQEQVSPPKNRMTAIEKQMCAARKEIEVGKETDGDDMAQSDNCANEAAIEGKKNNSSLVSRVLRRLSRLRI